MAGLAGREHTLARDLAGGWRQRLALGCAILHEPAILFLDEPTGGVDPLSRRQFWRLIDTLSQSGVTVLVTTHYLDEAERCHRVALIHAGRLATIGTTTEVKQVFAGRPILEIRADKPVEAMRLLDGFPEVEKTSLFGTAVHAVLRDAWPAHARTSIAERLRAAGVRVESIDAVTPSLEDVFLDVIDRVKPREEGGMTKALAVYRKELRQISRDRRTLTIDRLRAGVLPAPLRLRPQLRHPAHRARRPGPRRHAAEPRARLGVRQLRLFRSRRRRVFPGGDRSAARPQHRAGRAHHSRRLRARRPERPPAAGADRSSTATTRTPRRPS